MKYGRDSEVAKIVEFDRAVEIAMLMQGKLSRDIKSIFAENYKDLPRQQLKFGANDTKQRRQEILQWCRSNFTNASLGGLAKLYELIHKNNGSFRLPLIDFIKTVGKPKKGVLRGAPLHSTVYISIAWGLQTEFPEDYLVKDLTVSFNLVTKYDAEYREYKDKGLNQIEARKQNNVIAETLRHLSFYRRMCLICCFNLVEAYINGIAWEYVQENDISDFSANNKRLLEGQTSLLKRLMKIPCLITKTESPPLDMDKPPLRDFRDLIKPYRDSIVHASPFAAPSQFGGYDKLNKIYKLETETVINAVNISLEVIGKIHRFLVSGEKENFPEWIPNRDEDGLFQIEDQLSKSRSI